MISSYLGWNSKRVLAFPIPSLSSVEKHAPHTATNWLKSRRLSSLKTFSLEMKKGTYLYEKFWAFTYGTIIGLEEKATFVDFSHRPANHAQWWWCGDIQVSHVSYRGEKKPFGTLCKLQCKKWKECSRGSCYSLSVSLPNTKRAGTRSCSALHRFCLKTRQSRWHRLSRMLREFLVSPFLVTRSCYTDWLF